ncbi:MAG TPA: L-glutamate gamma-semialdehyde dehydrogenase [Terriglobia bacterium]|nr:L-glutamate gamma-semialdehyde dehydrogenase [Terriglobia bacterium]
MQLSEFQNEPLSDFQSGSPQFQQMQEALRRVEAQGLQKYPLVINGERIKTDETFASLNPARPNQVIGNVSKANGKLATRALDAAVKAFAAWSKAPVDQRVDVLVKTAGILRSRKHEFEAWLVLEAGKPWAEADAEVAEAIDFCEFYAREMLRLAGAQSLHPLAGEKNYLEYLPLGAGVVIPPWNFPLAILTGMAAASIVTGNTVVLKPSSDTPVIAYKLFEALEEAGAPRGVANFLPGPGAEVGDALVSHPKTRFVAFTGSKEVGLHINELAAKTVRGQIWIKRVIVEMGGKNSIVVDEGSDLDAAVEGVAVSAYGYQGQKCSACSRAIVARPVYEQFLSRLTERVKAIQVGDPSDSGNIMGPVINERAQKTILAYIDTGKQEGRLVAGGQAGASAGYFIKPTIIADVSPGARIAQEEIFGPVLAVIEAPDFNAALAIANNTEYGLTGAVYSRDRAKLDRAAREFHAGNLYFNRKCTGAMVGVHPFGGFNMSGTDSKAGGKDYLLLFTQAKVVSERAGQV